MVPVSAVPLLLSTSLQMIFICCTGVVVVRLSPQHMDNPTRYPTFPQPPPTRARCPKSLPRLVTPAALTRRNCGDVRGETPATPTATARGSDRGVDRVAIFSTFLSAGSTVLRVTTTGNHPSPTTAANALLTEVGDVRLTPSSATTKC